MLLDMQHPNSTWRRWGAASLAISALLFALFPLVRPFFDDLTTDPAGAALKISSIAWVTSHLMLIVALVLLSCGVLGMFALFVSSTDARGPAILGLVLTMTGAGLFLPVLGVEAFALPAIARSYLQGQSGTLDLVDAARSGLRATVFAPALLLLGLGGVFTAVAVWRSGSLPKLAGVVLALGLVFFMPLFPQVVRVADGILTGVGGLWLAWALMHTGGATVSTRTTMVRPQPT